MNLKPLTHVFCILKICKASLVNFLAWTCFLQKQGLLSTIAITESIRFICQISCLQLRLNPVLGGFSALRKPLPWMEWVGSERLCDYTGDMEIERSLANLPMERYSVRDPRPCPSERTFMQNQSSQQFKGCKATNSISAEKSLFMGASKRGIVRWWWLIINLKRFFREKIMDYI